MTGRLLLLVAALGLTACGDDDSLTTDGLNDSNAPLNEYPAVDMDDAPAALPATSLDEALDDPASPESGLADYGDSVLPSVDRPVTSDRLDDAGGVDADASELDGADGMD